MTTPQPPAIVLVKPQLAQNIGAVARAMMNFGLTDLRLVAPRDGWPNGAAWAMASGADAILHNAALYQTTEEAIAACRLVFATTARRRDMLKPVLAPRQAAAKLHQHLDPDNPAAILFGAERSGLDNDDVVRAGWIIEIPTNPDFSSLNIAQAVLLLGYEWLLATTAEEGPNSTDAQLLVRQNELVNFFERLETALDDSGFLRPPEKRPAMVRNLRNLIQRMQPYDNDIRTLHGVLSALLRLGSSNQR